MDESWFKGIQSIINERYRAQESESACLSHLLGARRKDQTVSGIGLFLLKKIFLFTRVPVCLYVSHAHAVPCGCQMKAPNPLELELQMVSCLVWVLGTEPRSSDRASRALHC